MAVSLNSVITFNPTARCRPAGRYSTRLKPFESKHSSQTRVSRFHLSAVVGGDNASTEAADKDAEPIQGPNVADPVKKSDMGTSGKRASLTARERLRAARVLSRYNDPKPLKNTGLGSSLLDSLRETDKGKKRPGLPEAPTNLLDDSKRGLLPKEGWTIEIPGGMDALVIVFSFVFISTVMFATTYVVWKVGAIHFNE